MSDTALPLESPKVRWDLSALFSGPEDPKVEAAWIEAEAAVDAFAAKYRARVSDLTSDELTKAITELETIYVTVAKPIGYASLLHAADSATPEIGAFYQSQRERYTTLSVKLLFFELELQKAKDVDADAVGPYAHYVRTARALSPFRLSEPEEI
ncbi:oligoendopeptidase F, partial [bacterium]